MKVLPSFCTSQTGTRREPEGRGLEAGGTEFSGFFAMQKETMKKSL